CIMLHGRPSMMLGAGKPRLRLNDTISLRDDRRCASKPRTKRACKACAAAGPLPHLVIVVVVCSVTSVITREYELTITPREKKGSGGCASQKRPGRIGRTRPGPVALACATPESRVC